MSERPAERLSVLDGLRGWAALSVVIFHLTWECFGVLFPPLRNVPLAVVANGNMAVALFLMVSGYVLTLRGWRNADKAGVRRSVLKRYFRLTIPIFVSVMLFWVILALGLGAGPAAGVIVERADWLSKFGHLDPNVMQAAVFGLAGVYLGTTADSFGPFLWTMTIELWGSYVVLGLCYFELPRVWAYVPMVLLTLLALWLHAAPYFPLASCYLGGSLVALMTKDGIVRTGSPGSIESLVATAMFAFSLLAAGLAQYYQLGQGLVVPFAMIGFTAALRSGPVSRFLALPVSQWLGRISFPLYLLQILVIVTLTSWLIIWAQAGGLLTIWIALGIAMASVVVCVAAAWVFLPVERLALRVAARIAAPRAARA
jgi:peptidoglycan/LPS O-acetylase OafA/YrhL